MHTRVPDECHMFVVSNSFQSLFSGSTNCFITTSFSLKLEALCNNATVMFPLSSPLNSRSGGPSCDSSITLLTKTSLLPRGGERDLGLHKEHVISKGVFTAPRQNVIIAPVSSRFQMSPSHDTSALKNHSVMILYSAVRRAITN